MKLTSILGFRYVAPEYANTGLLNEKSDIYSFGVLLLEAVTGRDPVDYSRPANEVLNIYQCDFELFVPTNIRIVDKVLIILVAGESC